MMGEVVLNIEGLVFGHKAPLVSQAVDISASAGDFICLVGRNGTGKTTMLSTLIGVKKPLSGHISICGVPLDRISAREKSRYISFVPSKVEAVLNMRIRDLIAVGRSPYTNIFDRRTKADEAIIEDFIQKFGLSDIAASMITEVSDGERQ
ncbi:MAG: ABC transporter ATP-binding protein, partial [Bacteroidales bacterium]|nr:ABC transporter ATP-binding protein [Bacteroidales bacterium]